MQFKCLKLGSVLLILISLVMIRSHFINKLAAIPAKGKLAGYIVAIDSGHGGRDAGSDHGGVYEKNITLMLSEAIAAEVKAQGGIPVLTRTTDTDLWDAVTPEEEIEFTKQEYKEDLQLGKTIDARDKDIAIGTRQPPTYRLGLRARLLIAQQNHAHILISIHTNHYRSESAKGAVTLYQNHSQESQHLALAIQRYLKKLLPGRSESGIGANNFFILRRSKIPAVLIEVGFISNQKDREYMLSESGQLEIATAIVSGIEDFFASTSSIVPY